MASPHWPRQRSRSALRELPLRREPWMACSAQSKTRWRCTRTTRRSSRSWFRDPTGGLFQLVDRARKRFLQQARQRAVGEDPAAGLATRAVVGLILGVDDPLHRGAADRAGLAVPAVDRHLLVKRGDFRRESGSGPRIEPLGPFDKNFPGRVIELLDLERLHLSGQCERRKARTMQDFVRIG